MAAIETRGAEPAVARGDPRALLAGDDWREHVATALAAVGIAAGVDRCYVFENLRGPDGRLWMDLIGEWNRDDVRGIFDEPGEHLHPYYPSFQRWLDVLAEGGQIVGRVEQFPDPERSALASEGTVSTWQLPIVVGDAWWGFVGIDVLGPADLDEHHGEALRSLGVAIGEAAERARVQQEAGMRDDLFRTMIESGPVITYIDAPDEAASAVYMSPQIEELVGYSAEEWLADPELWPRLLHADDRARALAENARHNETGEPFRLEYRMVHRDGRISLGLRRSAGRSRRAGQDRAIRTA